MTLLLLIPASLLMLPRSESIDKLISNLHVTEDERRRLVNTRIDPEPGCPLGVATEACEGAS